MSIWLMKSEPNDFSIDDLKRCKREPWNGVRNYQARNFMRDQMRMKDVVLFYHSNCKSPGIAGIGKVAKESYPDPTAWDPKSPYYDPKSTRENPRWFMVDVGFVKKMSQVLELQTIKGCKELSEFQLIRRGNRLSILPVSNEEYAALIKLNNEISVG